MTITAVKAQVKNSERVSVYIDGKYVFSLNHAQLLEQKLRSGLEVDEQRVVELKKISDFGKMYERALNFVMIRPRSRRELEDYCRRKKWESAEFAAVLERLEKRGYINDRTFAKAWVESRRLTKAMSARRLRLELKQKGITDEIVNQVFAESEFDEGDALKAMIVKKRRLARYQDEQKLMQYLARQGFSFDDIKNALDDTER